MSITFSLTDGPIVLSDINSIKVFKVLEDLLKPDNTIKLDCKLSSFRTICEFADYYSAQSLAVQKLINNKDVLLGATVRGKNQKLVSEWGKSFMLKIDDTDILSLINVANFLESENKSKPLYFLAISIIVNSIKVLSVEQIREKYHIENDLTAEDKNQLELEEKLWDEKCDYDDITNAIDSFVNKTA